MAIVWPLGVGFFQGWDHLAVLLPISFISFPIGGIIFGRKVWSVVEGNYLSYLENNPPHVATENPQT